MKKLALLFTTALTGLSLSAAPTAFDFKDPKGVNAIQFHLDSLLEPIAGTAGGVSGAVSFDPANPAATTGRIVVAANSLKVSNTMMTEHLHGDNWLNVAQHPEIVFELGALTDVKTEGNTTSATATGKFTLKGVTKEISVPVRLTHLAGAFGKRINKPEVPGDLLVLRGEFTIQRGDYGIQPGRNEDKVNPEVRLTLAIVGGPAQG
ncbi:MAG TPA: YceI family protein [Opitutaceae bacterium]|nr:YceI family protein [Opitutaceae bacterium]